MIKSRPLWPNAGAPSNQGCPGSLLSESSRCGPIAHTGCSHTGQARQCPEPPPVGKGHGRWASSHSNLSFRTLSSPHNGPGGHSRPARTPSLCTAGKWALPSTAGRGSSSAGTTPTCLIAQALGVDPQSSWGNPGTRGVVCRPDREETEPESQGSDSQPHSGPQGSPLQELRQGLPCPQHTKGLSFPSAPHCLAALQGPP